MDLPRNTFKQALAQRRLQIGLWSTLCSSIGAEILADSGFDWLLLDTEHAPNELPGLLGQLQAVQGRSVAPVIRVAWNDAVLIKRVLDLGVQSLLIPYVQTAREAERAVESVRYPPRGIRGVSSGSRASRYGRTKDYLKLAEREICVLVQVETRSALDELEAIAAVEGVDGVFIGPGDLAASFDRIGELQAPAVQSAIRTAAERLAKSGKASGILTVEAADARRYIEWGYSFVAVGVDTNLLARAAESLSRLFKP